MAKIAQENKGKLAKNMIMRQKSFKLGQEANAMGKKTARDSVGVKIMTILALFYLPATFVTVSLLNLLHSESALHAYNFIGQGFLQSGLISFKEESEDLQTGRIVNWKRLQVSREGVILFIAAAIPLTIMTMVAAYFWDRRMAEKMDVEMAIQRKQLDKEKAAMEAEILSDPDTNV